MAVPLASLGQGWDRISGQLLQSSPVHLVLYFPEHVRKVKEPVPLNPKAKSKDFCLFSGSAETLTRRLAGACISRPKFLSLPHLYPSPTSLYFSPQAGTRHLWKYSMQFWACEVWRSVKALSLMNLGTWGNVNSEPERGSTRGCSGG